MATLARRVEEASAIRARIFNFKGAQESILRKLIPPAYEDWRAGTTTLFLLGSLHPMDCLKILALNTVVSSAGILKHSTGLGTEKE
jgi:hypothetical protein